ESQLRGMVFWLMGDLSLNPTPLRTTSVLLPVLAVSIALARHLNLLARGETQAEALGLRGGRVRAGIFVAASLLTAAAVTTAGSIGFIGLITPHLVRMMAGSNHRIVLPGSALLGGILLVLADILA